MKTNTRYQEWIMLALMIAPFIYLAFVYNDLPQTIPFHYNMEGVADDFGPKSILTLIFGGMTVLLYLLFRYIPVIDPKQQLGTTNYSKIRLLITVFWSLLLVGLWYNAANGAQSDTFLSFLMAGVSLLIAGIGNLMYSIKPNYFVGIRTPWTLNSEFVWRKTHQHAAPFWVIGGLLSAVLAFLVPVSWKSVVLLTIALGLAFGSAAYSYIIYRQELTKINQ